MFNPLTAKDDFDLNPILFFQTKPKDVTTQIKALNKHILMVLFKCHYNEENVFYYNSLAQFRHGDNLVSFCFLSMRAPNSQPERYFQHEMNCLVLFEGYNGLTCVSWSLALSN